MAADPDCFKLLRLPLFSWFTLLAYVTVALFCTIQVGRYATSPPLDLPI